MSTDPAHPLTLLMRDYFRGEVTQAEAAKALTMRKSTFATFASEWACVLFADAIEALPAEDVERVKAGIEWRDYLRRFNASFPECDERSVRRDTVPGLNTDSLWRYRRPAPCHTFSTDQAAQLPPAQSGTGIGIAWDNRYWSIAPRDPRALPA